MTTYVEEREFSLRLVFRCEFPEDYEGDLDGYAWAARDVPTLTAACVRAAAGAVRAHGGFRVVATNRGRPAEDEVTLELTRAVAT